MTSPNQLEASTNASHISQLMVCHGKLPEEDIVNWQCSKDTECDVCGKLCAQGSAWLLALHAYLTGKRTSNKAGRPATILPTSLNSAACFLSHTTPSPKQAQHHSITSCFLALPYCPAPLQLPATCHRSPS
jgi:hypothetical protein